MKKNIMILSAMAMAFAQPVFADLSVGEHQKLSDFSNKAALQCAHEKARLDAQKIADEHNKTEKPSGKSAS